MATFSDDLGPFLKCFSDRDVYNMLRQFHTKWKLSWYSSMWHYFFYNNGVIYISQTIFIHFPQRVTVWIGLNVKDKRSKDT